MTLDKPRKKFTLLLILFAACFTGAFPQARTGNDRAAKKTILFLGNSLSAGYGLNPALAFPALIQQKIDSLKLRFEAVNAGLSGETSAGGLRRIDWLLKRKVDVLVLELGGNDALRGIAIEVTRTNLQGIIDKTKRAYPQAKIVIAGMQAPPNLGVNYTKSFRDLFPELAKENHATLVQFLLEGVGGVLELNQADRIHPTAQGHRIIAETIWRVLKPILQASG